VLAGLVVLLLALQVRLWTGKGSLAEIAELRERVGTHRAENRRLTEHNALLEAEVRALKADPGAVEARARSELGMIRDGETFYMILGDDVPGVPSGDAPGDAPGPVPAP
jgi:cell division protein FtsB